MIIKSGKTYGSWLIASVNYSGTPTFAIDANNINNKADFLKQLSLEMRLPSGMGTNFDSFDEIIQPDFWPELEVLHIAIKNFKHLEHVIPEEIDIFFSIIEDASKSWERIKGDHSIIVVI